MWCAAIDNTVVVNDAAGKSALCSALTLALDIVWPTRVPRYHHRAIHVSIHTFVSSTQLSGLRRHKLLSRSCITFVLDHVPLIRSEDDFRLTLVTPYHIKLLDYVSIPHILTSCKLWSILPSTFSDCNVSSLCICSFNLGCKRFGNFRPGRCAHIEWVYLWLVQLLPLCLAICHCRIFLLLKLLQSHLRNKRRRSVWPSMSWHDVWLVDALNFLSIVACLAVRLWLSACIFAVLLVLFLSRLLAVCSFHTQVCNAFSGTIRWKWTVSTIFNANLLRVIVRTSVQAGSICYGTRTRSAPNGRCGALVACLTYVFDNLSLLFTSDHLFVNICIDLLCRARRLSYVRRMLSFDDRWFIWSYPSS